MTTLSNICARCGAKCEMHRHQYYSGVLQRPTRVWHVNAPLYYLGDRGFCGPACATRGQPALLPLAPSRLPAPPQPLA